MELTGITANNNREFRNLLKAIPEEERTRSHNDALTRNHGTCCRLLIKHAIAYLRKHGMLEKDLYDHFKSALLLYATENSLENEVKELMAVGVNPIQVDFR